MGDKVISTIENLQNPEPVTYLSQREAAEIDEILMGPLGFSVDQLMVSEYYFFHLITYSFFIPN